VNALGIVITGQNPSSTKPLANAVIKKLRELYGGLSQKSSTTVTVREIHPKLWIFERPYTYKMFEIGLNTIVVKISDEELLIYNPSTLQDPAMLAELTGRGRVAYVMSGSIHHHAYFQEWVQQFPNAKFVPSIGLDNKKKTIPWVSSEERSKLFQTLSTQIQFIDVKGCAEMAETVAFHIASKTLITTDLFTYFNSNAATSGTIAGRLSGAFEKLTLNSFFSSSIGDHKNLRISLDEILALSCARVTLGHGQLFLSPDVKADMLTAFKAVKELEY